MMGAGFNVVGPCVMHNELSYSSVLSMAQAQSRHSENTEIEFECVSLKIAFFAVII